VSWFVLSGCWRTYVGREGSGIGAVYPCGFASTKGSDGSPAENLKKQGFSSRMIAKSRPARYDQNDHLLLSGKHSRGDPP